MSEAIWCSSGLAFRLRPGLFRHLVGPRMSRLTSDTLPNRAGLWASHVDPLFRSWDCILRSGFWADVGPSYLSWDACQDIGFPVPCLNRALIFVSLSEIALLLYLDVLFLFCVFLPDNFFPDLDFYSDTGLHSDLGCLL